MGRILRGLERLYERFTDGTEEGARDAAPDGGTTPTESRRPSELYQCPACETVFVAREKQTCDTCATEVEVLESTVPNAPGR